MSGWIKLHRSLSEWEWYSDTNVKVVFLHLLIKANHKPGRWKGHDIEPGSLATGRHSLSAELGLSEQQIRTALNKLKSTGEITIKKTNKFSIISMVNWGEYQEGNQQPNQQVTNNQPTSNQQVTTNKNVIREKGKKKEVKRFAPPTQEEVLSYMIDQGLRNGTALSESQKFVDFYESKGWMVGKNKMKEWKAAVRTWKRGVKSDSQTDDNWRAQPGFEGMI